MPIKPETKRILAESLQDLLKNHSFADITVQDITEHCGASRSAFYRHFKDKYDLMIWIYKNRVDEIIRNNPDIGSWKNFILEVTCFFKEKQDYFENILAYNEQNSFFEFLHSYGLDYYVKLLKKELDQEVLPADILIPTKLYCAGSIFIVFDWVKNGSKESPERITQLICDSIPQQMSKYFV